MSGKDVRETLGFLAVIASMVYVVMEIRQNTAAPRSVTVQAITSESRESLSLLASDSTLAWLRLRGNQDPSVLSELESYQFMVYYRSYWLHFQNVFFQRRLGVLEVGIWNTYAKVVCTDYGTLPGVRATWPDHSSVLDSTFVAFVESCPTP